MTRAGGMGMKWRGDGGKLQHYKNNSQLGIIMPHDNHDMGLNGCGCDLSLHSNPHRLRTMIMPMEEPLLSSEGTKLNVRIMSWMEGGFKCV